jgi:uncharacterized protein YraI
MTARCCLATQPEIAGIMAVYVLASDEIVMRVIFSGMLLWFGLATPLLLAQEGAVTATAYQTVNVRSGPGTQFEIVGQLVENDTVPVLGRDSAASRWLYIQLPDDAALLGWVAIFTVTVSGNLEALPVVEVDAGPNNDATEPTPEVGVEVIAFGRVNVRGGPSITYEVIGQLEIDDRAQALARSNYNNDWLYIENAALSGWVAYFTVHVRGLTDTLPVLVPDVATGELVPPTTLIRANFNAHLHTSPSFASPVTGIVPFQTQVSPQGISSNGRWLYVVYEDSEGWAWAPLFDITDEQLATIPRRSASATPSPTPVPEAAD